MGSESKEVGTDFDDLPDILSNIDILGGHDNRNGGLTVTAGKNSNIL